MAEHPDALPDGLQRVGWIGVGAMGLPICRHLLRAGCQVLAYDSDPARLQQAVDAGATPAASVRELAQRCDRVFSMVYDDQAFDRVVTGVDGLLAGIRPQSLYVDLSTVSAQVSQEMAQLLARQGVRYLRAPVSGSAGLAASGELSLLVSGQREDMEACLPIFRLFSRSQSYQGPGEAARIVKLIVNAMVVGSTVLIGEALALGEAAGLPRDQLVDAINDSIVGSRHYASRAEGLKERRYGHAGPIRMAAKDLALAFELSGAADLNLPTLRHAASRVDAALERGIGELEVTALAEPGQPPGGQMPAPAPTWTPALPPDLQAAEDARYAAMTANDLPALDRLLSEQLVYTHSDGQTDNKGDYLDQLRAGRLRYRRCDREDVLGLVSGEQALLRGRLRIEAHFKGREAALHIHFLAAWVRHHGAWQLAAWASTRLAQPS